MKQRYVVLKLPSLLKEEARIITSNLSFTKKELPHWSEGISPLSDELKVRGEFSRAKPAIGVESLAPEEALERQKEPGVAAVAPIMPMRLIAPVGRAKHAGRNVDPSWGIKAVGADSSDKLNGQGIVVAVLDTGIDANHPAFNGVRFEHRNFTDEVDTDIHGHGTHCAGTIFGRPINGIRIGIASGVENAVICKVLGEGGGDSTQIASAIQWALEKGANVISMSLGMDFPGYVKQMTAQKIDVRHATSLALEGYRANLLLFERLAGVVRMHGLMPGADPTLLVAAAGNESKADAANPFRISVSPPAVSEGIISVAAAGQTSKGLQIAPFSNSGAKITGPGVDILSAGLDGGLVTMSGTSMATPHVAGVAALWAQHLKQTNAWSVDTWSSRLIGNADSSGFVEGTSAADIGAGMVRAPK